MLKKVLLSMILALLWAAAASATPLVMSEVDYGWTTTILVYSDDNMDVYIPTDMINTNLFYTTYPRTGNFNFAMYIQLNNEDKRQGTIGVIKRNMENGKLSTMGAYYPDLLRFVEDVSYFDMQNNQITTVEEKYLDEDGNIIGIRDLHETLNLGEYPTIQKIAQAIAAVLEEAKNDPRNADMIAKIQAASR